MWKVRYENDTGWKDECFSEWWEVTDEERCFKCDSESDANWLAGLLNKENTDEVQ